MKIKQFPRARSRYLLGSARGAGLLLCAAAALLPRTASAQGEPKDTPTATANPMVRIYGIVRPEVIMANGVETFGKNTMVAPTAAAHPIANANHDEWANSFQLQQSRFGIRVGEGTDLQARAEVDFVDPAFSQSSPIQGSRLRLRLAYLTYKAAPKHQFTIGQAWDIFSPLNPASMNMVGVSYQAGNSAFIRPQAIYTYGTGEGLGVSAALGMQRQNTGPALNTLEYGLMPTVAVQVGYKTGKKWFGASFIGSNQMVQKAPTEEYKATYALNVFATAPVSEAVSVSAEAYVGKNTNALGLLTLGSGAEVTDAGGYVSAKIAVGESSSLWLLAGAAAVLNTSDLAIGYRPAVTDVGGAVSAAGRAGIGGIENNVHVRGTYVVSPMKGLEFYVEPFLFMTKHKLNAADDPDGDLGSQTAFGTQIGSRYTF